MNKFVDRKTQFPNRKILEVKRVERDETGELKTMCVEETRDEGKITEEGTPLNAGTLNQIISKIEGIKTYITEEFVPEKIKKEKEDIINNLVPKMIEKERDILIHILCTDEQKVKLDKARINIPTTVFFDFYLPTKGFSESNIEWEIQSGTAITIQNGLATVNTTNTNQKVNLIATITNGSAVDYRVFEINIPPMEDASGYEEMRETISMIPDGSSASIAEINIQLDENSGFVVENEHEDLLIVEATMNEKNELKIRVSCSSLPVDCGIREFNFIVRVGDKTTGQYTKWIYCTVDVIESISPED